MTPATLSALLLTLSVSFSAVNALNILSVFPYEGKSHFFVFEPLLRELTRRGHNVTVISYFPQKEPIPNYNDISLAGKSKVLEAHFSVHRSYLSIMGIAFFLTGFGTQNCRTMLADQNVQNLWKSKTKFDLVLVEQFNSDCGLGLAYKLGAPVIGVTSHVLMPWHYKILGIEFNPSYTPNSFFESGTKPTLYQRIESLFFHTFFNFVYKYFGQRVDQNTLAEYFNDIPALEDLGFNMKQLLLYNYFVFGGNLMLNSKVKEVGGFHVAPPKALPSDLKKFLEESEHGVIYVCFGTMLQASSTPDHIVEAIIQALAQLPQRIVWKWDKDFLPGNPKNIYLSNWLPQNDLLAHPKVVAFYSHCGMLGTTEALYHGVPVVGMPIFGDQPGNAAAIEESGLGVHIQLRDLTKDALLQKFKTVLKPKFRERVKQISKAWHDRPLSAMDTAIFWIEYEGRNSNVTVRTPSAKVPLYQSLNLDLIAVLIGPLFILGFAMKSLLLILTSNTAQIKKKRKMT